MRGTNSLTGALNAAIELLRLDAEHALKDLSFDMLRGSEVLVTGASGFVGSHLLSALLKMQEELDGDLSISAVIHRQPPPWLTLMCSEGKVTFYQGDLSQANFLDSLPAADVVIHAATYGQPGAFATIPDQTLKLNTLSTFSLIDKLRPGNRFLFLSSSEVYGGLTEVPFHEDQIGTTNTTHPRACYIEGKRCGEAICNAYRKKGIDAKVVRLCHAYGPGTRSDDRRAMASFIEQALGEKRIVLLDAGLARRSYCYISDASAMLWRILLRGREVIYNVGGDYRTTIAELAQRIGTIMNVKVVIPGGEGKSMPGAPNEVQVSTARFENEFGKLAFTEPEAGLRRTISWHEAIREIGSRSGQ
jgi:nucleoside-diphosphate-sugar epimerase